MDKKNIIPIIILSIILLMLFACNPQKEIAKAKAVLEKYDALDSVCADEYPVKDLIIVRDSIRFDTLYEGGWIFDTVYEYRPDTVLIITKTEPAKIITKTVRKDSTIIRRDFAYENELKDDIRQKERLLLEKDVLLADANSRVEKAEAKAKKRFWWIVFLLGAASLYTVGRIKKILPF